MKLNKASKDLSAKYKAKEYKLTKEEKLAYVKVRMPATSAAICFVLQELLLRTKKSNFTSIIDLGAGPGTLLKALGLIQKRADFVALHEKDIELIEIGKELFPEAQYTRSDITQCQIDKGFEVAIFSYSLNEIDPQDLFPTVEKAFNAAEQFLIIIEPGTPEGFERIRACREFLIKKGGRVLAPCPHNKACPMEKGDWCHFGVRLQRSKEHKVLKEGLLGYEDEKFSYVIVSKGQTAHPCKERILKRPVVRKGLIEAEVCAEEGIKRKKTPKSDKENFKYMKKASWGGGIG